MSLFVVSILLSLFIYFPAIHIGFLSDDWGYVYGAMHTSFTSALSFLWSPDPYGVGSGNFRPLQSILTVWSWNIIGSPTLIHVRSIILHGVEAGLVGMLLFQLYKHKQTALLGAFLFVLFPLNTEAVVWLSSWNSLLAAIPLTIACILYIKENNKNIKWTAGISALILLSLMAKEHALVFPLLALLLDLFLKRKISLLTISWYAAIDLLYLLWRFTVIGGIGGYKTAEQTSTHLSISFNNIMLYAKLPFAYVYNFFNRTATPEILSAAAYILSGLLFICVLVYLIQKKSLASHIRSGIILGALVYSSHLIGWNLINPLDIHNEHSRILYTVTIWAAVFMATLFYWTKESWIRYVFYAYMLVLVPLAIYQTRPWILAGIESKKIHQEVITKLTEVKKPTQVNISNLPDQYKGAFIFRNGMDYVIVLETDTKRNEIQLKKTMQQGIDLPVTIEIK